MQLVFMKFKDLKGRELWYICKQCKLVGKHQISEASELLITVKCRGCGSCSVIPTDLFINEPFYVWKWLDDAENRKKANKWFDL